MKNFNDDNSDRTLVTSSPLVGIDALILKNCSPWSSLACRTVNIRRRGKFTKSTNRVVGIQSEGKPLLVWVSNVVVHLPAKRAAAICIVNGIGTLDNLCVHPFCSRRVLNFCTMGPEYHQSKAISLAVLVFSKVLSKRDQTESRKGEPET